MVELEFVSAEGKIFQDGVYIHKTRPSVPIEYAEVVIVKDSCMVERTEDGNVLMDVSGWLAGPIAFK